MAILGEDDGEIAERWINLIMRCVTSMTYKVLLNGEPSKTIASTRGLREGNPIFLYLFLICAEGLSPYAGKGKLMAHCEGSR